jgi:hypothetical protein
MFSNHFNALNLSLKEQKRFVLFGLVAALLMSFVFQSAAYAGTTGVEFKECTTLFMALRLVT